MEATCESALERQNSRATNPRPRSPGFLEFPNRKLASGTNVRPHQGPMSFVLIKQSRWLDFGGAPWRSGSFLWGAQRRPQVLVPTRVGGRSYLCTARVYPEGSLLPLLFVCRRARAGGCASGITHDPGFTSRQIHSASGLTDELTRTRVVLRDGHHKGQRCVALVDS